MTRSNREALDALIAEATVDCYNDSECVTGFYTMLEEHLAVPFLTTVLGVEVTVQRVDPSGDDQIVAVCVHGQDRQRIPILDLPLPTPEPRVRNGSRRTASGCDRHRTAAHRRRPPDALTELAALANLRTVLELCAAGELRCSDKTSRPSAATMRTLAEHLAERRLLRR